jgi:polyphosphate glucokinase
MNVLVIDVGGTTVKMYASGHSEQRRFSSGRALTPKRMVSQVKEMTHDWRYDVVSIGHPSWVINGKLAREPHNLGRGWISFNFRRAFGRPVRLMNDAAMQALGSYDGGVILFVGLGTGLGAAIVAQQLVLPMELGHLSYRDGTYEDYLGARGLEKYGQAQWRRHVTFGIARLISALHVDHVVLGGGNARKLGRLPPKCRWGDNANAFLGGLRMWEQEIGTIAIDRSRRLVEKLRGPPATSRSRVLRTPPRRSGRPVIDSRTSH